MFGAQILYHKAITKKWIYRSIPLDGLVFGKKKLFFRLAAIFFMLHTIPFK
tara:strand:+ start:811 stop:963 length:153 start_codon:yes stop_codon:yes gene_type:complete